MQDGFPVETSDHLLDAATYAMGAALNPPDTVATIDAMLPPIWVLEPKYEHVTDVEIDYVRQAIDGCYDALFNAFYWTTSPQGHDYWTARSYGHVPLSQYDLTWLKGLYEHRAPSWIDAMRRG
jgi:hypothetical protein